MDWMGVGVVTGLTTLDWIDCGIGWPIICLVTMAGGRSGLRVMTLLAGGERLTSRNRPSSGPEFLLEMIVTSGETALLLRYIFLRIGCCTSFLMMRTGAMLE